MRKTLWLVMAGCGAALDPSGPGNASTGLRVPLLLLNNDGVTLTTLTDFNDQATAVGDPAFQGAIDVGASQDFDTATSDVQTEIGALSLPGVLAEDATQFENYPNLCFTGDGTQLADVINAQIGTMVDANYGLWAWKYKDKQWVSDQITPDMLSGDWASYDPSTGRILLVYWTDPNAGDVNSESIPACQ
jgi:hypothetical protein